MTEPEEMTRLTVEARATEVPAAGSCEIMVSLATVEEDSVDTVPKTKPTPVRDVVATACVSPTTLGTNTVTGPDETTTFTAVLGATESPAAGFCEMIVSFAIVEEACVITVPNTRPTPVRDDVATTCVSPTTFGTNTIADPDEIIRFTAEPDVMDVPAAGLCEMMMSFATVEEA